MNNLGGSGDPFVWAGGIGKNNVTLNWMDLNMLHLREEQSVATVYQLRCCEWQLQIKHHIICIHSYVMVYLIPLKILYALVLPNSNCQSL